ncbi:SAM-dependent methyltransferase [Streptomyces sp. SPB074]|nr:SAM-dependent methyltransferase [Streptomyces sp. SPB074]
MDISTAAVAHTARLGGRALCRSFFEPLPGEGRWGTVLLMDGNIGIGGGPAALPARAAALLAPGGLLLAETAPGDVDERAEVRVVGSRDALTGGAGQSFPWARVGTPALLRLAGHAGLRALAQWTAGGRSFVALRTRTTRTAAETANRAAVISSQWAR